MTFGEYQTQLLLATLQRASRPLTAREWLDRAVNLALDNGAFPAHLTGLNDRTLPVLAAGLAPRVTQEGSPGRWKTTSSVVAPVPKPPALPDRPMAALRKSARGRRRHDERTVAAQGLLAPQTRRAPDDPEALRSFAEDAARVLLRAERDIKSLRTRYKRLRGKPDDV